MNERERGICSRVRTFREAIKWSQSDFAKQLGITRDQLAGIEYCRTPLRYSVAWEIRSVFGISLSWLANESFPPQVEDLDPWPKPETLPKDFSLLSEVENSLWIEGLVKPYAGELHKKLPLHSPQRSTVLSHLKEHLADWLARVPEEKIPIFQSQLMTFSETFLGKLPQEPSAKIGQRKIALIWDTMRLDAAKRLLEKHLKVSHLTNPATGFIVPFVKGEWTVLKRRLQNATAKPGAKTKLAEFLGVDLTRVSQWLTDSKNAREPGAEYALKMLRWLEQRQRQK
jgi:transcriptional regulator with XRE-family HTH domain